MTIGTRKDGEKPIHHIIILDDSKSMRKIKEEALFGYNDTIQGIKSVQNQNPAQEQLVTVYRLNKGYVYEEVNANDVNELESQDYEPEGFTALIDSIYYNLCPGYMYSPLIFSAVHVTVITDGIDNFSEAFPSLSSMKSIIRDREKDGVKFKFIGVDINSEQYESILKKYNSRSTPSNIKQLASNEIFVFDTDNEGRHNLYPRSKVAMKRFGAIKGQAEGIQGHSYALPIIDATEKEREYIILRFIKYAKEHKDIIFLVSKIGVDEKKEIWEDTIPEMFLSAVRMNNIKLPAIFWEYL